MSCTLCGFLDTDEAVYDDVFDLNVKGYLFCAKRAVPFMLEAGGGGGVHVSCIHGHGGLPAPVLPTLPLRELLSLLPANWP